VSGRIRVFGRTRETLSRLSSRVVFQRKPSLPLSREIWTGDHAPARGSAQNTGPLTPPTLSTRAVSPHHSPHQPPSSQLHNDHTAVHGTLCREQDLDRHSIYTRCRPCSRMRMYGRRHDVRVVYKQSVDTTRRSPNTSTTTHIRMYL
jgi:hypothetical protein